MGLPSSGYPEVRLRRLRQSSWVRALMAETRLHPADFIWPVFVQEGDNKRTPIASMPGVERLSIDLLIREATRACTLGIKAISLFPVVPAEKKTANMAEAFSPNNLLARAITALKESLPDLGIICDVALDPYTLHGHDGVLIDGQVDNDATLPLLCDMAVVLAEAGCDIVAPSDMMDGRVAAIRHTLDKRGLTKVAILSYAAKYASAYYGPFREGVGSKENLGKADKRGYQMDPANRREAWREVELDIREGADAILIKPATLYLDIIRDTVERTALPVFAYHVSGEYAQIKAAAQAGWLDGDAAMEEALLACKRAGASAIFTYAALDMVEYIRKREA
jgi:porphobilinogen synthase